MEKLLTRINDEVNEAIEKQVPRATLELMFVPKDNINFDAYLGSYLDEDEHYLANIKAHYEFAAHFSLNVLFISVDFDKGKVTEFQHTMSRLFDSPITEWSDTIKRIKDFTNAKMQSVADAEVDKFNKEWSNCFKPN